MKKNMRRSLLLGIMVLLVIFSAGTAFAENTDIKSDQCAAIYQKVKDGEWLETDSLQTALDEVWEGGTVMLCRDVTVIGGPLKVKKALTLTSQNPSIRASVKCGGIDKDKYRLISTYAPLVLENIKIDGANSENLCALVEVDGTSLTMNTGAEIKNANYINSRRDTEGGGIYAHNGSRVIINGGSITGCRAEWREHGGAVVLEDSSSLEMNGGILSQNGGAKKGGAIYAHSGSITINNASLTGNDAQQQGGAIYSDSGSVVLNNCSLSENVSRVSGGAVYTDSGSVTISESSLAGNEALQRGGAVYSERGGVEFVSGEMRDNNAGHCGGAVYMGSGRLDIRDGVIANCSAYKENGGGVYIYSGEFTMSGGEIKNSKAGTSLASYGTGSGGGVYVDKGSFFMDGGKISDNWASVGGGGVYTLRGSLSIEGGSISGNKADCGGGILAHCYYDERSSVSLSGGTISANSAESGGGVSIWGDFAMRGGEISGNTAISRKLCGRGGGVFMNGSSVFTMSGGKIAGNKAQCQGQAGENYDLRAGNGGGINVHSGRLILEGGEIINNEAAAEGGAVCLEKIYSELDMSGGKINGNRAQKGGGVSAYVGTLTLSGGKITENSAGISGGGVLLYPDCAMRISSSPVVTDNKAGQENENILIFSPGGSDSPDKWKRSRPLVKVADKLSDGALLGISVPKELYPFINGRPVDQAQPFTDEGKYVVTEADRVKIFSDDPNFTVRKTDGVLELARRMCTLYYETNNSSGEKFNEGSYEAGSEITLPGSGELKNEGYVFDHWNTEPDGSGESFGSGGTVTISDDMSLYAIWQRAARFDGASGLWPDGAAEKISGCKAPAPQPPEREGYEFAGWFSRDGVEFVSRESSESTEYYAKWIPLISFMPQNGEEVIVISAGDDGKLTPPRPPKREGYKFDGWYEDENGGGNSFDAEKIHTEPTVYYALWREEGGRVLLWAAFILALAVTSGFVYFIVSKRKKKK